MTQSLRAAIVITQPGFHGYMTPLGYLYVSAALKQAGCDIRVVNAAATSREPLAFTHDALRDFDPQLLLTGTSYKFHNNCPSSTIQSALETTALAKSLNADCKTLLIGPLNSVLAPTLLNDPSVDALALGEPEDICVAVAQAIQKGGALGDVPGLALRDNAESVRTTGAVPFPDPNALPVPDRESVDYERYISDSYFSPRTTEVLTSRGCPFDCTYCFGARSSKRNRHNIGKPFRANGPERVVEEIDYLYQKYGVRGIKFSDVEFCVSNSRVREICELLLEKDYPDLRWRIVTHAKSVGPDLLGLMYKAGCRNVYYGVESGDPDILEAMAKRVTLDEIREAFRNTWRAGIKPEASFLLGYPGDTEESIARTIRFSKEIDPFVATFHIFVPFPGIRLEEELGLETSTGLDSWDVYQLKSNKSHCEVSAERLEVLSKKAYRSFYFRPRFLARLAREAVNPTMLRFLWNGFKGRNEGNFLGKMLFGFKHKST